MCSDFKKTDLALPSELQELEQILKMQLPINFIAFYCDEVRQVAADNIVHIYEGLDSDLQSFISIPDMISEKLQIDDFPENGLPVASDSCGNYYYWNMTDKKVYFWEHELDKSTELADNLISFYDMIQPFESSNAEVKAEGTVVWEAANFNEMFKDYLKD